MILANVAIFRELLKNLLGFKSFFAISFKLLKTGLVLRAWFCNFCELLKTCLVLEMILANVCNFSRVAENQPDWLLGPEQLFCELLKTFCLESLILTIDAISYNCWKPEWFEGLILQFLVNCWKPAWSWKSDFGH